MQGIWIRESRETAAGAGTGAGSGSSAHARTVKERVAIKELAEGTSPEQQRELVEEARVLASVQNYYCVKCAQIDTMCLCLCPPSTYSYFCTRCDVTRFNLM